MLPCYYAIGGLNFKNGFVTSCPQQWKKFQLLDDEYLPSKIFNNEQFREHRKTLMSGKWCQGCDMCEHVEKDNAGKSMRQEQDVDLSYYNSNTGETAFEGLRTIEIRFSHSCNMSCLHCSEVFSSGWFKKLKNYETTEEDWKYSLHQLTRRMHRDDIDDNYTMQISTKRALEIAEDLNNNFPNLERIDFAGGEVLYQKQFFPTLEKLSEHPNAKNIKIIFHSNFNADFDPVRLSNLLQKFGKASIMISVDAGPKLYPYFRQGDWHKLKQNIEAFREADNRHTELNLVCTTGTYQLMEIKDIFINFLDLDCDYIDSSIIYTPFYINPSVMMLKHRYHVLNDIEETRNAIIAVDKQRRADIENSRKLNSYIDHITLGEHWQDITSAITALENIRSYIMKHESKPSDWNSFIKYIEKTDKIWNQNFNDHIINYKFENGDVVRNV